MSYGPADPEDPILIVGGGIAALTAAQSLRELGFAGPIRVLASEAAVPYERPTLSKTYLAGASMVDPSELPRPDHPPAIVSMQELARLEIELNLETRVTALNLADRSVLTADGTRHTYGRLLLATGARSRRLGLEGEDFPGVHHLREVDDSRALPQELRPERRIVIIGGGVIGMEVAATAVKRGCQVTVVEAQDRVMARAVPVRISKQVARLHQAHGVRVLTKVRPEAITKAEGRAASVRLADGRSLPADAVVVGAGAIPNTELAEQAGIGTDNGIIVDEQFRRSSPDVSAAGDVARVLHKGAGRHIRTESWQPAQEQGRQAAAGILAAGADYGEPPWMWSDQYDATIQAAGFGFEHAEVIGSGGIHERTGELCVAVRESSILGVYGISHGAGVGRVIGRARMLIRRGFQIDMDQLMATGNDISALIVQAARRSANAAKQDRELPRRLRRAPTLTLPPRGDEVPPEDHGLRQFDEGAGGDQHGP